MEEVEIKYSGIGVGSIMTISGSHIDDVMVAAEGYKLNGWGFAVTPVLSFIDYIGTITMVNDLFLDRNDHSYLDRLETPKTFVDCNTFTVKLYKRNN